MSQEDQAVPEDLVIQAIPEVQVNHLRPGREEKFVFRTQKYFVRPTWNIHTVYKEQLIIVPQLKTV